MHDTSHHISGNQKQAGNSNVLFAGAGFSSPRPAKTVVLIRPSSVDDAFAYNYPVTFLPEAITPKEFFEDCPWLKIPDWRRAEILIEPVFPRGGLLGGATDAAPKKSKLAALAAARRKENAKSSSGGSEEISNSVGLLDKLSLQKESKGDGAPKRPSDQLPAEPQRPRKYAARPRVQEPEPKPESDSEDSDDEEGPQEDTVPAQRAPPSAFASVLVGSIPAAGPPENGRLSVFAPYQYPSDLQNDPFDGPSPDDIVLQAQKGSKALNKNTSKK